MKNTDDVLSFITDAWYRILRIHARAHTHTHGDAQDAHEYGVNNTEAEGQTPLLSRLSLLGENRPLTTAGLMVNTCCEEVTVFQWLQFRISRWKQLSSHSAFHLTLLLSPEPSPQFKPPH